MNVRTLEEIVNSSAAPRRFQMLLLLVFAAVAVALALIGIYGVLAYSVAQRTPEFGIRIALGAKPASILAMVLKQAGGLIAAGVGLGVAGAYGLSIYLETLLFQVHRYDWRTYSAAVAILAAAAILAALIPARRGSKIEPVVALRYE
jgi:ABC-type antimicrobial peptide transport system permease subunit